MKGTVTAKSGSTVKLRQKPSTDCPIYWNIPVGTEMEIVDQRENWSKCICGGLTGWMKNDFIGGLSARERTLIRTRTAEPQSWLSRTARDIAAAAGVPAHAPRATSPDPLRPNPLQSETEETEKDEALTLLADVYQELQDLCERILSVVGRG